MKKAGYLLVFFGIVAVAVGGFLGCGSLFTWNGRHAVATWELTPGTPLVQTFPAEQGRRYTAAVQIVFDRTALPSSFEGVELTAKMSLVAAIVDGDGNKKPVLGWIDTTTPPTLVYGRSQPANARGSPELVAERLIGPWHAPRKETAKVEVDVGPDLGGAPVTGARVVLYDDAKPTPVIAGAISALGGAVALFAGVIALFSSRSRRGGKRVSRSINVRAT